MAEIKLDTETDFSLTKLVGHLNEQFKTKSSGNVFTAQDVQQYVKRGNIPEEYGGGYSIEIIENSKIGIKVFRLTQ